MSGFSSNMQNYKKLDGGIALNISAPGKVILHGEHSVVYEKLAIAASLGLRTKVHFMEINTPNTLIFKILPLDFEHAFSLEYIQKQLLDNPPSLTSELANFNCENPKLIEHKSHLENVEKVIDIILPCKPNASNVAVIKALKCFLYLLSGIFSSANIKMESVCVIVDSELEMGAGTGSSASFSVTLAAALIYYLKLKSTGVTKVSRQGFKSFSWDPEEIEHKNFSDRQLRIISEWAFCCERIFHGTPSGLDNTICTYGNMVKFRKNSPPVVIKIMSSFKILLINTRVPRETSKLVAGVAKLRGKFPVLVNNILNAMDDLTTCALETISKMENASGDGNVSNESFEDWERLIQMNHGLLASLGVSHEKLEEVMKILGRHGLKGKLTGAGGGGFAISILPPYYDPEEVTRILKEHDFDVICTKLGGDGVRVD